MRIQQGNLRGKSFKAPPPVAGQSNFTPAKVKEAAFQMIRSRLGAELGSFVFFDLCLGSGQMALEALSLGFIKVHALELDHRRIRHFLEQCRLQDWQVQVHRRDFIRSVSVLIKHAPFVFYLDPPYSFWDRSRHSPKIEIFYQRLLEACHATPFPFLGLIQGPAYFQTAPGNFPGESLFEVETRRYGRQHLTIMEHLTP